MVSLLWFLVLRCLQLNVWFQAKHVPGVANSIVDALFFTVQPLLLLGSNGFPHRSPLPKVFVDPSLQCLLEPIHASLSRNTWVTYQCIWDEWVSTLASEFLLASLQDRHMALFSYFLYLQDKEVSGSMVGSALSDLSFWFRLLG